MRSGRMPEPGRADEVIVNDTFAKAHGFVIGSRFSAILNGRKRELVIVGTALSPEFIYTVGPGDIVPDDRRFGVIWMSEKALAGAYDLDGAFSSQPQASAQRVRARRDRRSTLCSIATAAGPPTAGRTRRRMPGSTTNSTCSAT